MSKLKFEPKDFESYVESPRGRTLAPISRHLAAAKANARLKEMLKDAPEISFIDEGKFGWNIRAPKFLHTHKGKIVDIKESGDSEGSSRAES